MSAVLLPQTKQNLTLSGILMCLLGASFYCYEYYLRVAPSVMSLDLQAAYHLDQMAFGHLAAFYYYAYTPLQLPAGILMDRLGPRRILSAAALACALGTWLFAADYNLACAQMGRFLVGAGSAFAYVGVLKIANLWLPDRHFALVAGLCTTLGMLGGMAGLTAMGTWVHQVGWQSALYYAAAAGLALSLLIRLGLQEPLEISENPNITSPTLAQPLTHLKHMICNGQMWLAGLIGCFTYLPLSVFAELWAVPYLKSIGFGAQQSAQATSCALLGFAIGGPIWGLLSDKWESRRKPLIVGALSSALFMSVLLYRPSNNPYLVCALLFACAFFAGVEILVFAVSNDINSRRVSATAAAFSNMMVMLGGVILQPAIGRLIDAFQGDAPVPDAKAFTQALLVIPLGLCLAAVLAFCLKETYYRRKV